MLMQHFGKTEYVTCLRKYSGPAYFLKSLIFNLPLCLRNLGPKMRRLRYR